MFIPIEEIKSGRIYRTGNDRFPFAYVLRVVFQHTLNEFGSADIPIQNADQIILRLFCKNGTQHYAAHEYFDSYEKLGSKRFIEEMDFPLSYNTDGNFFFVELEDFGMWHLSSMCYPIWQGSSIYSQANPYKFKHKLTIERNKFDNAGLLPILVNTIGLDKFIYFNKLGNTGNIPNGMPVYLAANLYFLTNEDYNLAKIILPVT